MTEIHFCARCGIAADCRLFYLGTGHAVWLCLKSESGSCWVSALDQEVYDDEIARYWHEREHDTPWDMQCAYCRLERVAG